MVHPSEIGEPIALRPASEDLVEYRKLPPGFAAVIRGITPPSQQNEDAQSESLGARFTIQLGRVLRKKPENLTLTEKRRGFSEASDYIQVPNGENAGDLLIVPIPGEKYLIDVIISHADEIDLMLYRASDRTKKIIRATTIHPSIFTSNGFDLNPSNQDNYGKCLGPEASQIIYDFHEGQEQFYPHRQSAARRALQSRTPPKSHPAYNLSSIVEANLADQYLDLMENYLELAIALGPQSSAEELRESADQELTVYLNAKDATIKREMEDKLKQEFDDLQTTGFERTLEMLNRFKKDDGEPEDEIMEFGDALRKRFLSTKKNLRTKMILPLIDLKQKMAVVNFEDYREIWLAYFPVGPRTIYWKRMWEKAEASGDLVALAEVSEGLREELGRKLVARATDFLEEIHTLNIDTGMPADEADQKSSELEYKFRHSPLSAKTEILRVLQDRADTSLLLSFPASVRLWGSILGNDKDQTISQLNNEFNNASTSGKILLARDLYLRLKTEIDAAVTEYASRFVKLGKHNLSTGLDIAYEDLGIMSIKERFERLPRSEQLRILLSGQAI